jgi:AraC-like DNA-binding protein
MQEIHKLKELVVSNKECYAEYLLLTEANHFNVLHQPEICEHTRPLHRNDFYKISLVNGKGLLQVGDDHVQIDGNVLIFFNPTVPYYWHYLSEETPSYGCYFDNHFQTKLMNTNYFQQSPLFNSQMNAVCELNDKQANDIQYIFENMCKEVKSDYHHKYDTLATYLQLLMQKSFQLLHASEKTSSNKSAATRIVSGFLNLLERQFPVDSMNNALLLKTPKDFATELAVHVNHLNHSVKEITGKQTSEIISTRMITEAKALLKHSHADIAEIAYILGFEYPSNFITFFKRHEKETPRTFRNNHHVAFAGLEII